MLLYSLSLKFVMSLTHYPKKMHKCRSFGSRHLCKKPLPALPEKQPNHNKMSNPTKNARAFVTLLLSILLFANTLPAQEATPHPDPVFPAKWSAPTVLPDHIILTFSGDPSSTQSVTWRTNTAVKNVVAEVALADGAPKFWRNAVKVEATTSLMDADTVSTANVRAHYHSVTFTNLLPDTMYAYRVGDGEHWSEWFQFKTAAKKEKPFSFLYVGDAQNYIFELWSRLIRQGFKKAPDAGFIIHAGDLINNAHSENQWHEWFTAGGWLHGMLPSVPTPGNHEYRGYNAADEAKKISHLSVQWNHQFTLPQNGPDQLKETVYFFDYQNTRIVSLNSNLLRKEQVPWLDSVLANNPNKWTVLTFHHPVFSGAGDRDNKELRDLWKPLIDKYKVDLVLTGHDHTYTRGQSPKAKNTTTGVNKRDGPTVYVVSVSGGKMYNLADSPWVKYTDAQLGRTAENTQLFQVINIDGNRLRYEAFTATGQLYDAFDLVKRPNKGNLFMEKVKLAIPERNHDNTIPYEKPKKK
jgi:3',5'-cyclic AMP phosphodiesterase CpdA